MEKPMILTAKRKTAIVTRFKAGASMAEIALWHEQPVWRIEAVIREWMIVLDKLEKQEVAAS